MGNPGHGSLAGYRLERALGQGAMGQVFLARKGSAPPVALKVCPRRSDRATQRFLREVEVGRSLEHPNLVRVLDAGSEGEQLYLAMELVEGRTLEAILAETGRFAPNLLLEVLTQLAAGLEVLHSHGLVHRDLKPANLMVDRGGRLKVMDLGLLHDVEGTVLTATGSLVGTPWYMAPEQVRDQAITPATDLFSMAVIAFELLTGTHPLRAPGQRDVLGYLKALPTASPRPWHPEAEGGPLDLAFRSLMDPVPAARPASATRLVERIRTAIEEQRRQGHSVETTLELPRPAAPPPSPPEVDREVAPAPEPSAPPAPASGESTRGPEDSRVFDPTGAGPRNWRRLWLAILGSGLFLAAFLWSPRGPGSGKLLIENLEARTFGPHRILAIRTTAPARLSLAGESGLRADAAGTLHVFRVADPAAELEIGSEDGTQVAHLSGADLDWLPADDPEYRYEASGDLVVSLPRPWWGHPVVARPGGVEVADSSSDPTRARFRIADPEGDGIEPLVLGYRVGTTAFEIGSHPASRSRDQALDEFLDWLGNLDVVSAMRDAGTGPEGVAAVSTWIRRAGVEPRYRLIRDPLLSVLTPGTGRPEPRARALRTLPRLLVLSAYLVHAGVPPGLVLGDPEVAAAFWETAPFKSAPAPGPGVLAEGKHRDFYSLSDVPVVAEAQDPLQVFVSPFRDRRIAAPDARGREHWLELFTNEWRAGFFAEATVGGHGPFFLCDDPSVDRGAAASRHGLGNPELRRIRLRLPAGVVTEENRVDLVFRPFAHQEIVVRPFAIVQAVVLVPVEGSDPPPGGDPFRD